MRRSVRAATARSLPTDRAVAASPTRSSARSPPPPRRRRAGLRLSPPPPSPGRSPPPSPPMALGRATAWPSGWVCGCCAKRRTAPCGCGGSCWAATTQRATTCSSTKGPASPANPASPASSASLASMAPRRCPRESRCRRRCLCSPRRPRATAAVAARGSSSQVRASGAVAMRRRYAGCYARAQRGRLRGQPWAAVRSRATMSRSCHTRMVCYSSGATLQTRRASRSSTWRRVTAWSTRRVAATQRRSGRGWPPRPRSPRSAVCCSSLLRGGTPKRDSRSSSSPSSCSRGCHPEAIYGCSPQ